MLRISPRTALTIGLMIGSTVAVGCASACPRAAARAPREAIAYPGGIDPHGSLRAFAASHFSPAAWRRSVGVGLVQSKEIFVPVGIAIAALAVAPSDLHDSQEVLGTFGRRTVIGDAGVYTLVGSSFALGVLHPRAGRAARDEAWLQTEAFALTFGVTFGLKTVVGRLRPLGSSSPSSFPSGHTSAAFCAATLISRDQGPALGIPAFALASLTGFSRIESGRHYPSDVVAGAAIGTLCALVIDALHFGAGSQTGICTHSPELRVDLTEDGRPQVGVAIDL